MTIRLLPRGRRAVDSSRSVILSIEDYDLFCQTLIASLKSEYSSK